MLIENDEIIMLSFQILLTIYIQNTSECGLAGSGFNLNDLMRIPCGCNQFEIICIQCTLFSLCRQAFGATLPLSQVYWPYFNTTD